MEDLQKELSTLLNRYGVDNRLNTPDYILADYLINCLNSYSHLMYHLSTHRGKNERTAKES